MSTYPGGALHRPLQLCSHPATPNGCEKLWVHTEQTLAQLQPTYVPFDETLQVGLPRSVLVMRPCSKAEVWALIIDLRRSEGVDDSPALSKLHDFVLGSQPTGGGVLRIAAAHPHIMRTVFSDGGNLHGSIAPTRIQLQTAAGVCCLTVATYQAKFIQNTLLPRVSHLSSQGHASLAAARAGDVAFRDALADMVSQAAVKPPPPWPVAAAQLGTLAQRALHSAARQWDNVTGGAYAPAGEGTLGDLSYEEDGKKQKCTAIRKETKVVEALAMAPAIGLLLRDVATATRDVGMESVLQSSRPICEHHTDYVYPPEVTPNESLGQTQYGVRLKGFVQDGHAWQLNDAERAVSALHCDNGDVRHRCVLLGKYNFTFSGALVYVGIKQLARAKTVPETAPKKLFGVFRSVTAHQT